MMKKAIQIGAGNIGRGFIGALLANAGYEVVFADVNEEIISKINLDKCYTVNVTDVDCSSEKIENIRGVISTGTGIIDEISSADIITTAVGLVILPRIAKTIHDGICLRHKNGSTSYLNIIACENAVKASSQLKAEVLKLASDEIIEYIEKYIGFPDSSVDRIVPPVKSENIIDVVVEKYYEWNVEKAAFKGDVPSIDGMTLAENLMAYIERKLFTLNTGHAITAYIGYLKGHATIDESIKDDEIYKIVINAMTESGMALIKTYGFNEAEHLKYINKIIKRFENPHLKDDVSRVSREPIRKLSPGDRIIKPLLTAHNLGLNTENIIIGAGAALHYNNPADEQSCEMQSMISNIGLAGAISKITGIDKGDALIEKLSQGYEYAKSNFM